MTDELIFGIYGFEFAHPFRVHGIHLEPFFKNPEVHRIAGDPDFLRLTGFGRLPRTSKYGQTENEAVSTLIAGMTFAQLQMVMPSRLVELSPGDSIEKLFGPDGLGSPIPLLGPRHSHGPTISPDGWSRSSLDSFLSTFFDRFAVERSSDPLRAAAFRLIEVCRLTVPYVEIHHFLTFSGLELLARANSTHGTHLNAAVPIFHFLKDLGFVLTQIEVEEWTATRNAAFHNGQLTAFARNSGREVRIFDHLYPITTILADSVLRLLPFDDGHINWNRWRDRMSFT